MSIATVEQEIQARIAQPAPNYGVIAVLLLAALAVVVGLSYQSGGDARVYIDEGVPQIVNINGP
jgi:hypothetical protein